MLLKRLNVLLIVALVLAAFAGLTTTRAQSATEVLFYYPTAVGGPISQVIEGYAAEFNAANPDVKVTAVFAGGYADIYKAVDTALKGGGQGPDVAIFLTTDMYSLIDNDYIIPLDDFIKAMPNGEAYLKDFFPAFLLNSQAFGQTWGIPFQRSTPVLYYNKTLFKENGLDPEKAPANWQELRDFAAKLTTPERWGLLIPSEGFPYWLFQGFAIGNGQNLVGEESNKVYFNTPSTVEALEYFANLSLKDGVMPKGIIKWGDTPADFWSGKAAMIYHTTGSLTNILKNANFEVGVGYLPAGKVGYGAPTGGGNLYILKSSPAEKQAAAWRWIQFLTTPEKQADWTVATGYIAARQAAWQTETLKKLVAEKPQYAVARDQLQYAAKELSTHRGSDVQRLFAVAVHSVLLGEKDAKTALDEAQAAAEALLAEFQN
jgi:sn-glycerol 3-phosphate transport system substrate-binding protein